MHRRCLCAGLLVLLAGCRVDPGLPPATVKGLPGLDDPADQLVQAARDAVDRGRVKDALVQVESVLKERPDHVDAHRLRQDLLRRRGRYGRLLNEARERLAKRPDDADAHYLAARIAADPDEKQRGFERAAQLAPGRLWPWLGLAFTTRTSEPERALTIYRRLFDAARQHPLVGIAYAAALRLEQKFAAASLVYESMRDDPRARGVADLGIAEVALARNEREPAWRSFEQALRQRPFDPGVRGMLQRWLDSGATLGRLRQAVDVLREDGDRMRAFARDGGAATLAELLQRVGQPLAAHGLLEHEAERRPTPATRRALRRAELALGNVGMFLRCLTRDIPADVVGDESNELRATWLRLLGGPWYDDWQIADADQAHDLLVALRDVGMLREVELLAEVTVRMWPERATDLQALQDEARRQLAFEAGMRRMLYRGYRSGDTSDLDTVLGRLRELSQRVFGRDVVGDVVRFEVPLVGEMLDPFAGDLAAHLARYNRHLVLGRRSGGTAEGLLFSRLSVRELPEVAKQTLQGRSFEVVGFDRDVKALGGVLGSDLAGVALLNHFLIDYDAVVDWAIGLHDRRRIAREDELQLLADPIPDGVGLLPLDVAWRLTLRSPVPDDGLTAAVLAMIRSHERRHLVDSFYYLPIERNLLRGMGLLFEFGLSPAAIEAEMERRAELAALALCPHTELVLAHIADFYGDPPLPSPHHLGFSRLLEQLHAELVAGGVDAARAAPSRWHELPMAEVRAAASRLLDRLPM